MDGIKCCCSSCGYWEEPDEWTATQQCGLRKCTAAVEFWDHTGWDEEGDNRILVGHEDTMMFTRDYSDYHSWLLTRGDHYCSSWKGIATS